MSRNAPAALRVALLAPRCLPWHAWGGLERHVLELARHLRRVGVEVDLFTSTPEHPADPFAGDPGFRLHVIPGRPALRWRLTVVVSRNTLYPLFSLRMGRRVASLARERSYAAVIAQGLTGFGFALWRSRTGLETPLLLNPQGMEEAVTPSPAKRALYAPFRALTRYAGRRSARIIATDEALVPVVGAVFGVPRDQIVLLPNAVDVAGNAALVSDAGKREALASVGASDASPLLVTVGRLAPNKGFGVALEALSQCERELPSSWRWVVVGDGPLRAALEREARGRGLLTHVTLAGNLGDPEMHNLIAAADVFLNPTLYEGSSLVTLEAMGHARPIVATRAGGIPDKILEPGTGWLASPGDGRSLAAALLRCWRAGADARHETGEAARRRCLERFDWPVVVERYVAVIRELAAR